MLGGSMFGLEAETFGYVTVTVLLQIILLLIWGLKYG